MARYDYDLFVIGGGSGGVRAARLVAGLGKKVAIAEEYRFGGTCVIRGCVPKKLYVYASQFSEYFTDAAGYGWTVPETKFDWPSLVAAKEREISRLEAIYSRGVREAGAEIIQSRARLVDAHTIFIEEQARAVTADQILIATGGRPNQHEELAGREHCIFSEQAFDLPRLPRSIAIAGGGYIAVEFASIFHGLGVETALIYRGPEILRGFDMDMRRGLREAMEAKGIRVVLQSVAESVGKCADGRLDITLSSGGNLVVEEFMLALGRTPNSRNLGLEAAGVATGKAGEIVVDAFSRTSAGNIWAVGDVTNRVNLTPVAIQEAMCFVETAFRDNPLSPDHETIATAVFSQPEIGTVGLSEEAAGQRFEAIDVYRAVFRPMRNILAGRDEKSIMKLVVDHASGKVVGAHMLGPAAAEMAQLIGVSLKAGLTKADFDRTMALHPTAAEELVTMYKPSYTIRNGRKVE